MNDNKLTFWVIFALIAIPVISILVCKEIKREQEWRRKDMVSKIQIDNISRSIERTTEHYAAMAKERDRKYREAKAEHEFKLKMHDAETQQKLAELELEAARKKAEIYNRNNP